MFVYTEVPLKPSEIWNIERSEPPTQPTKMQSVRCTPHTDLRERSRAILSFVVAKCAVSKSERILCKAFSLMKSKQDGAGGAQSWGNRHSSRIKLGDGNIFNFTGIIRSDHFRKVKK